MDISDKNPPIDEYMRMREGFGWTNGTTSETRQSLEQSLIRVCLEIEGEFIGFGRVVGDGILNFYIQDVMVKEAYRGRGYGRIIMENIMAYIHANAADGSFVALFSSAEAEDLYKKFGFRIRPRKGVGAGMSQTIVDADRRKDRNW